MILPRKVLLFGRTLLIEGVNASLQPTDGLEIERIESDLDNLAEQLQMTCPDVVVFDLVTAQAQDIVTAMRACPSARLIGLDANRNASIVMSSQQFTITSTRDLLQIIHAP